MYNQRTALLTMLLAQLAAVYTVAGFIPDGFKLNFILRDRT